LEELKSRFSPKYLLEEKTTDSELELLFGAARISSSSYNEQPWRFIYSRKEDEKTFNRMLALFVTSNKTCAGSETMLMLSIAKSDFTSTEKQNKHALHDTGLAVMSMIIRGMSMGIYARQMASFDIETKI
jgi:nitroreductase